MSIFVSEGGGARDAVEGEVVLIKAYGRETVRWNGFSSAPADLELDHLFHPARVLLLAGDDDLERAIPGR